MTTPNVLGYVLTLAGCPYYFTTDDMGGTLTSTDAWWPDGATEAPGFLVQPDASWTERAKPLDGDLEVDGLVFRLYDARIEVGPAAGEHLFSYLATRDPESITSSPLTTSIGASATSFPVGDGAALDPFPRVLWMEREALLCDSRTGNTVSVLTRGYLGTTAERHAVSAEESVYPEVFTDFPWTTRRRAVLWAVTPDLEVAPVWAGFCQRAPRLNADGAVFELQCEHLWTMLRELPAGPQGMALELYGLSNVSGQFSFTFAYNEGHTSFGAFASSSFYASPDAMVNAVVAEAIEQLRYTGSTGGVAGLDYPTGFARREGTRWTLSFDTQGAALDGTLFSFGESVNARPVRRTTGGTPVWTTTCSADNVPRVAVRLQYGADNFAAGITSGRGLPGSWAAVTTTFLDYSTTVTPSLRAVFNGDFYMVVTGVTFPAADRVLGTGAMVPRKPGAEFPEVTVLTDPGPLEVVYTVATDHWALGLRDGLLAQTPGASVEDWDFDNLGDIIAATGRDSSARTWFLDGQRALGDWVRESCLLHGCSPVVRDGRLALQAWRLPLSSAEPADTFTAADIRGNTGWETWVEGFVNRMTVRAEDLTINATDAGSIGRYGPGRPLSLDLTGMEGQRLVALTPAELARTLLSRLALWSVPVAVVRLETSITRTAAELGSVVSITDWASPNGQGGRGLTAAKGLVVSRTLNLGEGTRELEVVLFNRVSYGYAPCVRVESWDSTTVAVVARNYVDGANDYSGDEGITDDGGAQRFQAGDAVQVIQRSANGTNVADREVVSVVESGGVWRITLDAAVASWRTSGIVDIRAGRFQDVAGGPLDAFVYAGDASTHVIDGTATASRRIAP